MSIKIKLLTFISLFALTIGLVVLGVFAATNTQTIKIDGSVDFNVADKTFYVKDVRIKNDNTLSGQGTTIDNFMPGYINSEFKIDLGSVAADTSFTLYFDIINTTDAFYSADEESSVTDATVSASGIIRGDAVNPTNINESTAISGTVELNVTISNPSSVDLNKITILLNEYQEPEIEHSNVLDFTFDNNTVTSYTGSSPDMVIPSSYSIRPSDGAYVEGEDYAVTGIGEFAFANNKVIESATIPESITSLGNYSFANCTNIDEINFNASAVSDLTTNNGVFYNTGKDTTGITVNIASTVISIPSSLFCPVLNSTVTSIPTNKPNITSVNVQSTTLTTIGSYAFAYNDITSFTIPESVTNINDNAFLSCRALTEINYNAISCNDISSTDNRIFANAGQDGDGITVNIGASVKNIPARIFYPSTLSSSFRPNLVEVIIKADNQVESIGSSAFRDCANLTTVDLSECLVLTTIGSSSFYNCTGLTSIEIPENVSSIGSSSFYNCTGLTEINYNALSLDNLTSYNTFYDAGDKGDGITLNIGTNVTAIPNYLFSANSSLHPPKITIIEIAENSDLQSIGNCAFAHCSYLAAILIPDGVTSIGDNAFEYCHRAKSLTIPESVISIGNRAFYSCGELDDIEVNSANVSYHSENNCLIETSTKTLLLGCKNSIIPTDGSVTTIGESAFFSCNGLNSFVIPEGITTIGRSAFFSCDSLTSITIPESVTSLGDRVFDGCTALEEINYNAISIRNNLTQNSWVFWDAGIDGAGITVNFGKNVTEIPQYLFHAYNSYGSSAHPPKITTVVFSEDSQLETIETYAFYRNTNLFSIIIPSSVTSIGADAFSGCSGLTSATFKYLNGWRVSTSIIGNYINLSADKLRDTSTAATYLRSTYGSRTWTRS